MKWTVHLLAVVSLAAAGCDTVKEVYHPQVVGPLAECRGFDGIKLTLTAPLNVVPLDKPAMFSVKVRNTSDHAIWLPKNPQQGFFWTYPNGRHDCYMIDREESRFFKKSECMLLMPNGEIELPGRVETTYDRPGITEFLAEINVARNTNPELEPFWSGRAFSNAYGLQMVPFNLLSGPR